MDEEFSENIVVRNNDVNNLEDTPIVDDDVSTMAYEDTYYSSVLRSLNNINSQQNVIIQTNDKILKQTENVNFGFDIVIFILCIFFIYSYIRNMLRG